MADQPQFFAQGSVDIGGVKTDVVVTIFGNATFVVVTQLNKLGTLVSALAMKHVFDLVLARCLLHVSVSPPPHFFVFILSPSQSRPLFVLFF